MTSGYAWLSLKSFTCARQVAGTLFTHPRLLASAEVHPHREEGVRVTGFEEPSIAWRKSTASNSGGCVEVAVVDGWVLIRDSFSPHGVVLRLPPAAWSALLTRARSQDFGLRQA